MSRCHHHRLTPDCPYCRAEQQQPAPTLTTLEREVVMAAEVLTDRLDAGAAIVGTSAIAQPLFSALHALRAARKPAGVMPSEVAPGTRFRFANNSTGLPWTLRRFYKSGARYAGAVELVAVDHSGEVYRFNPEDLILPLDPQEQE